MKEIFSTIYRFIYTDGLLYRMKLFVLDPVALSQPLVDAVQNFIMNGVGNFWGDAMIDALLLGIIAQIAGIVIIIFACFFELWIFCAVPYFFTKSLQPRWRWLLTVGYLLLINFIIGTNDTLVILGITVAFIIMGHMSKGRKMNYSTEEALSMGTMKLNGQEIYGVKENHTTDGINYSFYSGGEEHTLMQEYTGSSTYYDEDGHKYIKDGSTFY